jgi:hypothetical protein
MDFYIYFQARIWGVSMIRNIQAGLRCWASFNSFSVKSHFLAFFYAALIFLWFVSLPTGPGRFASRQRNEQPANHAVSEELAMFLSFDNTNKMIYLSLKYRLYPKK